MLPFYITNVYKFLIQIVELLLNNIDEESIFICMLKLQVPFIIANVLSRYIQVTLNQYVPAVVVRCEGVVRSLMTRAFNLTLWLVCFSVASHVTHFRTPLLPQVPTQLCGEPVMLFVRLFKQYHFNFLCNQLVFKRKNVLTSDLDNLVTNEFFF